MTGISSVFSQQVESGNNTQNSSERQKSEKGMDLTIQKVQQGFSFQTEKSLNSRVITLSSDPENGQNGHYCVFNVPYYGTYYAFRWVKLKECIAIMHSFHDTRWQHPYGNQEKFSFNLTILTPSGNFKQTVRFFEEDWHSCFPYPDPRPNLRLGAVKDFSLKKVEETEEGYAFTISREYWTDMVYSYDVKNNDLKWSPKSTKS